MHRKKGFTLIEILLVIVVASGVACGLKESGGLDMGVLRSTRHATSALVDTSTGYHSLWLRNCAFR